MKPSLKRFKQVAERCDGNITDIASTFGVYRSTVYDWMEANREFKRIVNEYRGRLLDRCLRTADFLANGVPIFVEAENKPVFAGWKVQPDGNTLRYLISTLGRKEGYGEAVDITTNGDAIKPEPVAIEIIDKREQVIPSEE